MADVDSGPIEFKIPRKRTEAPPTLNIDFWGSGTKVFFHDAFYQLVDLGMEPSRAMVFLEDIYAAVGSEYGD